MRAIVLLVAIFLSFNVSVAKADETAEQYWQAGLVQSEVMKKKNPRLASKIPDWVAPMFSFSELSTGRIGHGENIFEIRQVLDDESALVDYGDTVFILRGVDTTDHTDGSRVLCSGIFVVEGTQKYTTVLGGSKTVYSVRMLSAVKARDAIAAKQDEREWRIANVPVNGKFAGFFKGQIYLRAAGKESSYPIKSLSKVDRKWLNDNFAIPTK